jgi:hypothetical protein
MRRLLTIPLLILSSIIAGCASNPLKEAETAEQKAFAVYGTFVVAEETAAKLVLAPGVPANVKEALRRADREAKPAADALLAAAQEVILVRRELAAGTTTEQKLQIATTNLLMWYESARPKVQALVDVIKGVE